MSFYRNENTSVRAFFNRWHFYLKMIDPPTSAIDGKEYLRMLSVRMTSILRAGTTHDQWNLGAYGHEQPDQALS